MPLQFQSRYLNRASWLHLQVTNPVSRQFSYFNEIEAYFLSAVKHWNNPERLTWNKKYTDAKISKTMLRNNLNLCRILLETGLLTNPKCVGGKVRPVGEQLGEGVGLQLVGGLSKLCAESLAIVCGFRIVEDCRRFKRLHANPLLWIPTGRTKNWNWIVKNYN